MTEPLFSFAVLADTHIRAPEGDLSSPYAVNTKANARAEVAAALNLPKRQVYQMALAQQK